MAYTFLYCLYPRENDFGERMYVCCAMLCYVHCVLHFTGFIKLNVDTDNFGKSNSLHDNINGRVKRFCKMFGNKQNNGQHIYRTLIHDETHKDNLHFIVELRKNDASSFDNVEKRLQLQFIRCNQCFYLWLYL